MTRCVSPMSCGRPLRVALDGTLVHDARLAGERVALLFRQRRLGSRSCCRFWVLGGAEVVEATGQGSRRA